MTPEDRARQKIEAMSVVEELAAVVSAKDQRATRRRQSVLQRSFTGAPA
jgi:hypothetical protein